MNKGTLAWGQDGLLAYAAHSNVVVIEPTTVQTFQCLTRCYIRYWVDHQCQSIRHRSPVVGLVWGQVEHRRMQLASSDATGEVII